MPADRIPASMTFPQYLRSTPESVERVEETWIDPIALPSKPSKFAVSTPGISVGPSQVYLQ